MIYQICRLHVVRIFYEKATCVNKFFNTNYPQSMTPEKNPGQYVPLFKTNGPSGGY